MILFAILMLLSSILMIRGKKPIANDSIQYNKFRKNLIIVLEGFYCWANHGFCWGGWWFSNYTSFSFINWFEYEHCRRNIVIYYCCQIYYWFF